MFVGELQSQSCNESQYARIKTFYWKQTKNNLQIDEDEFEKWAYQFRAASVALDDREEKLAEATDFIERDMVGTWQIFSIKCEMVGR